MVRTHLGRVGGAGQAGELERGVQIWTWPPAARMAVAGGKASLGFVPHMNSAGDRTRPKGCFKK